MSKPIVKREGHEETFDDRKVYASCYAACLNVHIKNKEEAEGICDAVTREVAEWVEKQENISSDEIFKRTTEAMRALNEEAAFMYESHRDIS